MKHSIEFIKECLFYQNGKLYWKYRPITHFKTEAAWKTWNKRFPGQEAGTIKHKGYALNCRIFIDGKQYRRSTLTWLIHHDEWVFYFRHKNNNLLDDSITNIEPSTMPRNLRISINGEDIGGIVYNKEARKYEARLTIYLGSFKRRKEAIRARKEAEKIYYEEVK